MIIWPTSQTTQVFENVEMDRFYAVREDETALTPLELGTFRFP
jgi:hypothetical protein